MAAALPGGPQLAAFNSLLDPSTGRLPSNMNLSVDQTGNNMLRQQALSNDFSPWTKLAMQNQNVNQMNARSQSARDIAKNNLEMSKQGASPISAINAMRNNMAGMQATNKSGQDALMKLQLQDQADKSKMLMQQVQNDVNVLKPEEFNITNAINEKRAQDLNQFTNWQEQMKAWASTESAKAQINAGKK